MCCMMCALAVVSCASSAGPDIASEATQFFASAESFTLPGNVHSPEASVHTHTEAVRTRRFLLLPRAKVAEGQRIFVARCSRKALKSRRRSADLCSEMQPESFACKTQYRNSCFNCSPKASQMHLTSELSFWGQAPKILQLPPQPLALRAQAW